MIEHLRTLGVLELTDSRGEPVEVVMRQPKRLALLAYLAAKRPSSTESRDRLLGLFWPELDQQHARNALNKTLHFLRQSLGQGVVVSHGRDRVGVAPDRVDCDAVRFRAALDEEADSQAVGLYLGDFLPGLFLTGVPEFHAWLDTEREWYRKRARATTLALLDADLQRGRTQAALDWATALHRIAPNDEEVVRASVKAHLRAGDRPGAMSRLERYEAWLRSELGMGVPADLVRLLAESPAPRRTVEIETSLTGDPPPELLAASREAVKVETLEEYREFVDLLPDIVYRCDIRGSFPFVNDVLVKTMGWSAEELRDKSYDELVREDFRDRVIEFYVRQVDDRIPVTYLEFPAVTRDGREIWVGQSVRMLERDGSPVGMEAVTRDITTRIRRETANRRTALEDRETRLLNRDAFSLMAQQRIRENRRSEEPFFVLHVRLNLEAAAGGDSGTAEAIAVRVVGGMMKQAIRESDIMGRIGELEIAVLAASGAAEAAHAMLERVKAVLAEAAELDELSGVTVHCEPVVHDAAKLQSPEALMTFAWVVEE